MGAHGQPGSLSLLSALDVRAAIGRKGRSKMNSIPSQIEYMTYINNPKFNQKLCLLLTSLQKFLDISGKFDGNYRSGVIAQPSWQLEYSISCAVNQCRLVIKKTGKRKGLFFKHWTTSKVLSIVVKRRSFISIDAIEYLASEAIFLFDDITSYIQIKIDEIKDYEQAQSEYIDALMEM